MLSQFNQQQHAVCNSVTNIKAPVLIARSKDIYGEGNYTFGCSFSPDGLCVLTSTSADNILRLYNTPPSQISNKLEEKACSDVDTPFQERQGRQIAWEASLTIKEGGSIRGYTWYPMMDSYDPSTCIFLSTCRDQPIHLIDAYSGAIRCSYRAYDNVDAIEAAQCVTFTNDGQRIFAGFNRSIKIFHTSQPGRDCCDILHMGKTKRSRDGQKGIVSAIAFPKTGSANMFAVGTYAGSIFLYDDRATNSSGDPTGVVLSSLGRCIVEGQSNNANNNNKKRQRQSSMEVEEENIFAAAKERWFQQIGRRGITQLQFLSSDENILFSASRRSNAVVSWDIRMLGSTQRSRPSAGLASYERDGDTNQKLQFDMGEENNRLFVGSRDKCVNIYDISSRKLVSKISHLNDAANGVSYSGTNKMLAVSIGARTFPSVEDYDENSLSPTSSFVATSGVLDLYRIH